MDNKELIQLFLQGQLDEAGQTRLAFLVETDPDFASLLEIEAAFYAKRSAILKEDLRESQLKKKGKNENKESARIVKLITSIAATLLVCVLCYFAISQNFSGDDHQKLASDYLLTKHFAPVTLMGENDKAEAWSSAIEAYKVSNYQEVINSIRSIRNPNDEQILYLAISKLYLEEPDTKDAIEDLEKILENKESIVADQANWFLALAHIRLNNITQAKSILTSISDNMSWQHKNASQLLNSI